jgi:murein L,D-transpeptidase YafK
MPRSFLCLLIFISLLFTCSYLHAAEQHIIVTKSERKLELYQDTDPKPTHTFKIGLGHTPIAPKERSGDGKTPEGTYFICVKNPKSKFYLSLGISYPNAEDAARGLKSDLIERAIHDQIVAAEKRRITPPWNTALGGEIFIHGRGATSDWTLGCIALDDTDMKTLFDLIEVGTIITIKP